MMLNYKKLTKSEFSPLKKELEKYKKLVILEKQSYVLIRLELFDILQLFLQENRLFNKKLNYGLVKVNDLQSGKVTILIPLCKYASDDYFKMLRKIHNLELGD